MEVEVEGEETDKKVKEMKDDDEAMQRTKSKMSRVGDGGEGMDAEQRAGQASGGQVDGDGVGEEGIKTWDEWGDVPSADQLLR